MLVVSCKPLLTYYVPKIKFQPQELYLEFGGTPCISTSATWVYIKFWIFFFVSTRCWGEEFFRSSGNLRVVLAALIISDWSEHTAHFTSPTILKYLKQLFSLDVSMHWKQFDKGT